MSDCDLIFHHLGLALIKDDEALTFLKAQGYKYGDRIYDPEQNVHLRMCRAPNAPAIEIILPGEGEGPLTPILKKYTGLIYHCCYETEDLAASLQVMEELALRVLPVAPSKPAILFEGRNVSFYHVTGFGLIEILEP
jgi:methylmalonyl-CoA/ethylmalonyl-CoA epimerase